MSAFEIAVCELNDVLVRSSFAVPKRVDIQFRAAHAENVEHPEVDLQLMAPGRSHIEIGWFAPLEVRLLAVHRRVRGMKRAIELPCPLDHAHPLKRVGNSVGASNPDCCS